MEKKIRYQPLSDVCESLMRSGITDDLSHANKKALKKGIDAFFTYTMGANCEMILVVDANVILTASLSKLEGKRSLAFIHSPHLKLYAPAQIHVELKEKIAIKAKELNKDATLLSKACDEFMTRVSILNPNNSDHKRAIDLISHRDIKDSSYVGLIFTTKSHGIITNDNDIKDVQDDDVQVFSYKDTGRILTAFEVGSLSFFSFEFGVVPLTKLFFRLLVYIVASIIEFFAWLFSVAMRLISRGVEWMAKNVEMAVLIAILGFTLKDEISAIASQTMAFLKEVFTNILNFIRSIFVFLGEIAQVGIEFTRVLLESIDNAENIARQL